jgi:hypothetical protein
MSTLDLFELSIAIPGHFELSMATPGLFEHKEKLMAAVNIRTLVHFSHHKNRMKKG